MALDQDAESCAEVSRAYPSPRVAVVETGIERLIKGKLDLGKFDLIYSAGLYDYLPDAIARRLTRQLLGILNPGGHLLIANFAQGAVGEGYLSLFMEGETPRRARRELRS